MDRAPIELRADEALAPLKAKPLAQFLSERTAVEFVLDDVLRRGWLYALTACTGHAKTGVAVVAALHIGDERSLGGHEMQGGPVIYVAGENPEDVQGRFTVACQELKINPERARVHVVDRSFILAERAEELQAEVERLRPVAVFVDTDAAVSLSGDTEENDNADRMAHAKRLRALTRCSSRPVVIYLCHPRARATENDLLPRGGSAFLNEIDGNLCLWRDGDTAKLFSDPNKYRGAPVAMNFAKHLITSDAVMDSKGRPIPVPYFRLIDDAEADQRRHQDWTDENRLILVMYQEAKASQREWAKSCQWLDENGEPKGWYVNRLLQRLEKSKPALVRQARSKKWHLTDAGTKEAQRP